MGGQSRAPERQDRYPAEAALASCALLAGFSVLILRPKAWGGIAATGFLAAVLLLAVYRSRVALPRAIRALRTLLPLLLIGFFYAAAGRINVGLPLWILDGPVERLERALFGGQPSLILADRWPSLLLSEVLHASYFSYFLLLPLLPAVLLAGGREGDAARVVFLTILCFAVCFVFYLWLPVTSPLYIYPPLDGRLATGFFHRLAHAVAGRGGVVGGAFPSGHAALSALVLLLAWRLHRPVFWITLTPTLGILLATVYGRFHFAVDTLAGVLVAWILFFVMGGPARRPARAGAHA